MKETIYKNDEHHYDIEEGKKRVVMTPAGKTIYENEISRESFDWNYENDSLRYVDMKSWTGLFVRAWSIDLGLSMFSWALGLILVTVIATPLCIVYLLASAYLADVIDDNISKDRFNDGDLL